MERAGIRPELPTPTRRPAFSSLKAIPVSFQKRSFKNGDDAVEEFFMIGSAIEA
jgi:hypothetical protein